MAATAQSYDPGSVAQSLILELVGRGISVSEDQGIITVVSGDNTVRIAEVGQLLEPTRLGKALLKQVAQGRSMVIALGQTEPDQLRVLMSRGVFDVHSAEPDIGRLGLAALNALDLQRLRWRVSQSADQLKRLRYEFRELTETARAISSEHEINSLLDKILEKCRFLTNADAGSIYVVEGEGALEERRLRFKLAQNESMGSNWTEFSVPISRSSMAGAAALDRQIINLPHVRDLPADGRFHHDVRFDQQTGYKTCSILTVPMISPANEVIGVVQLINRKKGVGALLLRPADFEEQVIAFDQRSLEVVRTLVAHAAVALENARLYENIRSILDGFVKAAALAIEQRDPPTSGHSERVAALTCSLAQAVNRTTTGPYGPLQFAEQELLMLRYAGLLHDFGKIGVREQVLMKERKLPPLGMEVLRERFEEARLSLRLQELSGAAVPNPEKLARIDELWEIVVQADEPTVLDEDRTQGLFELSQLTFLDSKGQERCLLTTEELERLAVRRGSLTEWEMAEVRSHARKSLEFLSRIPWGKPFSDLPRIAAAHHERLDGSGYPEGLTGDAIPLPARMLAVADVFDALTAADRPYKKAVSLDRALDILTMEARAGHLDDELVRLFAEERVYDCVIQGDPS